MCVLICDGILARDNNYIRHNLSELNSLRARNYKIFDRNHGKVNNTKITNTSLLIKVACSVEQIASSYLEVSQFFCIAHLSIPLIPLMASVGTISTIRRYSGGVSGRGGPPPVPFL